MCGWTVVDRLLFNNDGLRLEVRASWLHLNVLYGVVIETIWCSTGYLFCCDGLIWGNNTIGDSIGDGLRRDKTHAIGILRRSTGGAESASEVPASATTAWKLLVTLRLCLSTIAAGDRSTPSRLRNHAIGGRNGFLILVSSMNCVMSLKEIPINLRLVSKKEILIRDTYLLANDMWQVKHLNGLTLVSSECQLMNISSECSLIVAYESICASLDAHLV